jgi:hypothetical protein
MMDKVEREKGRKRRNRVPSSKAFRDEPMPQTYLLTSNTGNFMRPRNFNQVVTTIMLQ